MDPPPTMMPPVGSGAPSGWYVWWRRMVPDDMGGYRVDLEISDADMTWMVGPSGWPGCPDGISCTRYGIDVLGFDPATRRYHHMHRVTTGSDGQENGTFSYDSGALTVTLEHSYSCAHPSGGPYVTSGERMFQATLDGEGLLWWNDGREQWVYRPISAVDAHNRYDHPYCGADRKHVAECYCLCPSQDVLSDYACGD